MAFLMTVMSGLKVFSGDRVIDDFTDRLHYTVSSGLLVALAILVSFKQFGGKPVECMVPETFSGAWEEYAENYCFAMNTYFLPMDEQVPVDIEDRTDRQINYYQWVPFILVIEAACFQLPFMVWKVLGHHSGIRIHDLVEEARDKKNLDQTIKAQTIDTLKIHLANALSFHKRITKNKIVSHSILRCLNLKYTRSYVSMMYITFKFLNLINALVQFLLMNLFLDTGKYDFYGWGVMSDILNGTSWESTGVFPRVTLCDYEVRGMGNVRRYSMQCVLVINMLNEKIFVFLWFWYNILILLTSLSLMYWSIIIIVPHFNRAFITRHLELCEMPFDTEESAEDIKRFVGNYLRHDGIFIIRMIEASSSVIFGTDLIMALWQSFFAIEGFVQRTKGGHQPTDPNEIPIPIPPPPIHPPNRFRSNPGLPENVLRWRHLVNSTRQQEPGRQYQNMAQSAKYRHDHPGPPSFPHPQQQAVGSDERRKGTITAPILVRPDGEKGFAYGGLPDRGNNGGVLLMGPNAAGRNLATAPIASSEQSTNETERRFADDDQSIKKRRPPVNFSLDQPDGGHNNNNNTTDAGRKDSVVSDERHKLLL